MIKKIDKAIEEIEAGYRLPQRISELAGQSSPKVKTLLNSIIKISPNCYLEIGVYYGSTFVSALYQNDFRCAYAIDNWSQFGGERSGFEATLLNLEEEQRKKIKIIESDCWTVDVKDLQPVNVYFYDGNHREEDQCRAFTYYNSVLANEFIAIVDDWNEAPIQNGTRKAFTELGYQVLKEWQLFSNGNGDRTGWWNGLFIAVIKKSEGYALRNRE